MSEVTEFLSENPDMGQAFQEFATQHQTLAEVWGNCARSDWLLWILYKRKYRNAEKLERYIGWLRNQVQEYDDKEIVEMWLTDFDAYKVYSAEQIDKDLEQGTITQGDARYSRFIGAWSMAYSVSDFVLHKSVDKAIWSNIGKRMARALAGEELHPSDIDAVEIRFAGMKNQAGKLRELIGNPFVPERSEDFYYGRGQIG